MLQVPSAVLSADLDASARLVLLALYAEANAQFAADPTLTVVDLVLTQSDIARRAKVSRASVVRHLPTLIARGLVSRSSLGPVPVHG